MLRDDALYNYFIIIGRPCLKPNSKALTELTEERLYSSSSIKVHISILISFNI